MGLGLLDPPDQALRRDDGAVRKNAVLPSLVDRDASAEPVQAPRGNARRGELRWVFLRERQEAAQARVLEALGAHRVRFDLNLGEPFPKLLILPVEADPGVDPADHGVHGSEEGVLDEPYGAR